MPELQDAIVHVGVPGLSGGGVTSGELATALAATAPTGATYITQTAHAGLSAEQALSSIASLPGIAKINADGSISKATGADLPSHNHTGVIYDRQFIIDGGGSTITTGIKGDFRIPVASTITEWNLFADQSGSIQIDLWRDTYTNYPPVNADSITGSAPISMTSVDHYAVATAGLTGWDTTLDAGDIIRVNVDSVTSIQRVTLVLWLTRTIS